jgi:DNA-binding transcriptional ArsR family regulator
MKQLALNLNKMQKSADLASQLMKILANPDRLLILCQLSQREMCVSQIEDELGILQPTLSQQLVILRDKGLVSTRRDGKNIYYQINSAPAQAVLEVLYAQFCKH